MDSKPTAAVKLEHTPQLTRIETHRVIAVIEKAIERLELLAMLDHEHGGDVAAAAKQSAAAAADDSSNKGVGAILDEQKTLEKKYEQLLAATKTVKPNPLEPQLDPTCYSHVKSATEEQQKRDLEATSIALKQQSQMLCRQLKDNPNDADNWKKIASERRQLIDNLRDCVRELATSSGQAAADLQDASSLQSGGQGGVASYEGFAKTVIQEKDVAEWAEQLVQKEKLTNQNVKSLQADVKKLREEKEKELDDRQRTIADLKTDLRQLKQNVKEAMDKMNAENAAMSEATERREMDRQRVLKERILRLRAEMQNERTVSNLMKNHITAKMEEIDDLSAHWTQHSSERVQKMTAEKAKRERQRNDGAEKLRDKKEQRDMAQIHKADRDKKIRADQNKKSEHENLANAKYNASTKLQAAIKGYFTRQFLVTLKKKFGKKKK